MSEGQNLATRLFSDPSERALLYVTILGLLVGVGKVLVEPHPWSWGKMIGVSMLNAVSTLSAFTILAFIPDAPLELIVGFAALIGTMGAVGMIKLLDTILAKRFNVSLGNGNQTKE